MLTGRHSPGTLGGRRVCNRHHGLHGPVSGGRQVGITCSLLLGLDIVRVFRVTQLYKDGSDTRV